MEYRILRTITDLNTGIQYIANYCQVLDKVNAHELLFYFLGNAFNTGSKIIEVKEDGFTQQIGGSETWKFEIVEYKK